MKTTVRELVFMAFYAALFIVLDYMSNMLPKMPNGGSLGLGVIPILLASYHLGAKKGVVVGLLSIVLQFMTGQIYYLHPIQFFLDYILAFGIYGIAVLMPNKGLFYSGVVFTNVIRYISSTIAGVVFYSDAGSPLRESILFSANYNAAYMIPTMVATMILVPLAHQPLKQFMR